MNDSTDISNRQIVDEILISRNDLKNSIEASEARLLLKIEELNHRINVLERENSDLKDNIEVLHRKNKKNNIVVFGVTKEDQITSQFICQQFKTLLDVNLLDSDINDVYRLGKSKNNPIKIEFLSFTKKAQVLANCHKLKGKRISVAHDLTIKQQQENKILRHHLSLYRQDKSNNCYIKRNKLIVNGRSFTSQQLEDEEICQVTLPNSAPSTPKAQHTTQAIPQEKEPHPPSQGTNIQSPNTGAIKKQQTKGLSTIKDKLRNRDKSEKR